MSFGTKIFALLLVEVLITESLSMPVDPEPAEKQADDSPDKPAAEAVKESSNALGGRKVECRLFCPSCPDGKVADRGNVCRPL